jgi:hypothetical protein
MAKPVIKANYDLFNRTLARLFVRWTRTLSDSTVAFFWDPALIVAGHLAGLGMNRMWLKPSLDFEKVFVFGEFSRKLLLDAAYPEDKIVVAGQPLLDEILARRDDPVRQAQIASHIGVAPGNPYLLLNVEPSLEHNYATKEEHWCRFHEVMRACSNHGLPVVLSLHPLCDVRNYKFAEAQYGARISTDVTIHELLLSCTVNVSFVCSTNLLAQQFGKPLVVYDYQRIIGRDKESEILYTIPGMLVGRGEEELRRHIATALRSAEKSASVVTQNAMACSIIEQTVHAALKNRSRETVREQVRSWG